MNKNNTKKKGKFIHIPLENKLDNKNALDKLQDHSTCKLKKKKKSKNKMIQSDLNILNQKLSPRNKIEVFEDTEVYISSKDKSLDSKSNR